MKVITIKQPFASLIAAGYKEYEFRTWKTKYRGDILIHAGKGVDREAMKKFEHLNLNYPSGCIIAKAKLVDCVCVDDSMRKKLLDKDSLVYSIMDSKWQGYGFKLESVKDVKPIYVNGKLSLWDYDY